MKKLAQGLTPLHRIRTRVFLVDSPKLYPWANALCISEHSGHLEVALEFPVKFSHLRTYFFYFALYSNSPSPGACVCIMRWDRTLPCHEQEVEIIFKNMSPRCSTLAHSCNSLSALLSPTHKSEKYIHSTTNAGNVFPVVRSISVCYHIQSKGTFLH